MTKKPTKKSDIGKPWERRFSRRKVAVRALRKTILVVCDDEKSSVYYLNRLNEMLPRGSITLHTVGTRENTQSLVDSVDGIKNREEKSRGFKFDEVWVFFDKDSFDAAAFDNAIVSGEAKGYKVAWSNECFEVWYLLHFKDQRASLGREKIFAELGKLLGENYLKGEKGKLIHRRFAEDREACKKAIKRAETLDAQNRGNPPHMRNPVTRVYLLLKMLDGWIRYPDASD